MRSSKMHSWGYIMRNLYIGIILSFIMGIGSLLYYTKPCFGGGCFDVTCFSSSTCAGDDCVCLKKGSQPTGTCYSIGRADSLIKQGWERIE